MGAGAAVVTGFALRWAKVHWEIIAIRMLKANLNFIESLFAIDRIVYELIIYPQSVSSQRSGFDFLFHTRLGKFKSRLSFGLIDHGFDITKQLFGIVDNSILDGVFYATYPLYFVVFV